MKHKQTVTACISYHRTLRPTVHEAAGSFFVETVVGSRGFGHLLHYHLGLDVLLCSGIYCDMGSLKTHKYKNKLTQMISYLEKIFCIFIPSPIIIIFNVSM